MNATQFAWLYLIQNGTAGVKKSYYGGYDIADSRMKDKSLVWGEDFSKEYLKEIKEIGVNWYQTLSPKSSSVDIFEGTFCEPHYSLLEIIIGTLVLNNGIEQTWTADTPHMNVFEMMAHAAECQMEFNELFGNSL